MKKLTCLFFIIPAFCFSQKMVPFEIKETIYGIYTAQEVSHSSNENSVTGISSTVTNILFFPVTDTIPLEKDIRFGIKFILESNKVDMVDIEIVWIYPTPISNESGKEFVDYRIKNKKYTNNETFTGYHLSENYEMVPGKWTLQIFYKKKKIHEHFFYLIEKKE